MAAVKGYKVFNPDWTCRGMKYEVGRTYKHDGPIAICRAGFHFCLNVVDCFGYYPFDPRNKVAEIKASGLVKSDDEIKFVTNEITIVREISWHEMLVLANEGEANTGLRNVGDRNTGNSNAGSWNVGNCNTRNWNTGSCNAGDWNAGSWNAGGSNTGDRNTGNGNAGIYNTGNCNAGSWNAGNCNAGSWNAGNHNTGFFSTITPKISLFEKPTDMTYQEVLDIPGIRVLNQTYKNNWWIYRDDMTDEEKAAHPEHEKLGGYLKTIPFKDACALMWQKLSEAEKRIVLEIPNFDADIFYRITGIQTERMGK